MGAKGMKMGMGMRGMKMGTGMRTGWGWSGGQERMKTKLGTEMRMRMGRRRG